MHDRGYASIVLALIVVICILLCIWWFTQGPRPGGGTTTTTTTATPSVGTETATATPSGGGVIDVNIVIGFLKMLFQAVEAAFKTAFSDPLSGVIIGAFLFLMGRLAKALEAAGILIIIVALVVLVVKALGLKIF